MSSPARFATLFTILVIGACASTGATPYQEGSATDIGAVTIRASHEGFVIEKLGGDRWNVTFEGNHDTSEDTAQTYGLYRCADIALAQGYEGFEILSNIDLASPLEVPYPSMERRGSSVVVPAGPGLFVPIPVTPASKGAFPVFSSDIRLVKKPLSGQPPKVFDAAALRAALEPYVKGKKCDNGNVCPHSHDFLTPMVPGN